MRITRCVVVLALAVSVGGGLAQAQNIYKYTFMVGSGFLCDSSDSSACPATVKAARGDNYEFSGVGTFDAQEKTVKGAGTFTHKSANGRVLETGVWTAEDLVSFVSYGAAPGALFRERNSFGPMQSDPRRMKIRMLYEPMPTGGRAVFRVHLLSIPGAAKNAILQVNCALGDVPPEHSAEGVQLNIEANGGEYSESVSGRVIFLAMRPEASAPARTPTQGPAPQSSEGPPNGHQSFTTVFPLRFAAQTWKAKCSGTCQFARQLPLSRTSNGGSE